MGPNLRRGPEELLKGPEVSLKMDEGLPPLAPFPTLLASRGSGATASSCPNEEKADEDGQDRHSDQYPHLCSRPGELATRPGAIGGAASSGREVLTGSPVVVTVEPVGVARIGAEDRLSVLLELEVRTVEVVHGQPGDALVLATLAVPTGHDDPLLAG
jgi:hypothetical protein